eukprot:SAG11_NODE_26656_length_342_cov_1.251029_1_plen_66_part_10
MQGLYLRREDELDLYVPQKLLTMLLSTGTRWRNKMNKIGRNKMNKIGAYPRSAIILAIVILNIWRC